jgi:hypothetical protein
MGRVVPILVRPLLCHPLFPLPLEAKLILVTLFSTIAKLILVTALLLAWNLSLVPGERKYISWT